MFSSVTTTSLYRSLAIAATGGEAAARTESTKAIETIDNDVALLELVSAPALYVRLTRRQASSHARARTRLTEDAKETIDDDREALWLAPGLLR